MADKEITICPMPGMPFECMPSCAWWCEEEKACAVKLIPSSIDWASRFIGARRYSEIFPQENSLDCHGILAPQEK